MSQNDFQIANDSGAAVRADLNSALQALATISSGNSAPGTTYAGQLWWDTGNDKIKIRNGANSAWVDFAHYDGVTYEPIAAGSDVLKADPEHATDSATDTYDSATNTTPPADGVVIIRDFQSASTTTTPTLDGKTLTTKDGSALWADAVSGVHALQRDQTADTYLLLDPIGTDANINNAPVARDANGRAKFADPSAAQDAATKNWGLAAPSAGSDPALAFDTWRTPNANRSTLVVVSVRVTTDSAANGIVDLEVDDSGGTTANEAFTVAYIDNRATSSSGGEGSISVIVPAGGSYQIKNTSDPQGSNQIEGQREYTL